MSNTNTNTFDQEAEDESRSPLEAASAVPQNSEQPQLSGPVDGTVSDTYHEDARLVKSLINPLSPDHAASWDMVLRLVRSIIRKQLFSPVNDRSIEEDDLLQVALVEIANSLRRFHYRCRLTTWLHQITINSLRRGYRDRNAERRRGGAVELPESVAATRDSVAEEANWQRLIGEILQFLGRHPDTRLSKIFYQSFVEEQRLADIGRNLNLSTARIHMLIKLICQLLRDNPSLREQACLAGLELEDDPQ